MSKADELKKEAEKYAEQCYGWCNNDQVTDVAIATYITSAEPREKRIEELEMVIGTLRTFSNEQAISIEKLKEENAELKKKIGIYQKGMYDEIEKRDKKLTKAKEIIKNIIEFDVSYENEEDFERNCELYDKIFEEAEQFLKEIEKMNKEELKQEADESAKKFFGKPTDLVDLDNLRIFKNGYLASAEPREKRIVELEEENNKLLDVISNYEVKVADLEKQIEKMKKYIKACWVEENLNDYSSYITNSSEEFRDFVKELNEEIRNGR